MRHHHSMLHETGSAAPNREHLSAESIHGLCCCGVGWSKKNRRVAKLDKCNTDRVVVCGDGQQRRSSVAAPWLGAAVCSVGVVLRRGSWVLVLLLVGLMLLSVADMSGASLVLELPGSWAPGGRTQHSGK